MEIPTATAKRLVHAQHGKIPTLQKLNMTVDQSVFSNIYSCDVRPHYYVERNNLLYKPYSHHCASVPKWLLTQCQTGALKQ